MNETEELGTLTPRNIEEPASRCNICGQGLSSVEALLYGNRCLWCCDHKKNISFFNFLSNMILDFLIYRKTLKWSDLKEECPDCFKGVVKQKVDGKTIYTFTCTSCNGRAEVNLGRVKMIGYLGACGASYYEQLTIKQKKELLKELRRQ